MKFEIEKVIDAMSKRGYSRELSTVTISGVGEFTGFMCGDDECFDRSGRGFYQWLICPDGYAYKMFFELPEDPDDPDESIDWNTCDLDDVNYHIAHMAEKFKCPDDYDLDDFDYDDIYNEWESVDTIYNDQYGWIPR